MHSEPNNITDIITYFLEIFLEGSLLSTVWLWENKQQQATKSTKCLRQWTV